MLHSLINQFVHKLGQTVENSSPDNAEKVCSFLVSFHNLFPGIEVKAVPHTGYAGTPSWLRLLWTELKVT